MSQRACTMGHREDIHTAACIGTALVGVIPYAFAHSGNALNDPRRNISKDTDTSSSVEYLDHIAVRDTARSSIIGVDPDTRRLQLLQPHILVVDAVAAPTAVITDQLQRINAAVGIVRPFFNRGVSGNAAQLLRMQIVDGFAEYLDLSARCVKRLAVFNVITESNGGGDFRL